MTSTLKRWLPALAAKLTFTALKHSLHLQTTVRGAPRVADQVLPAPPLEAVAAENGSNASTVMCDSRRQYAGNASSLYAAHSINICKHTRVEQHA